MKLRLRAADGSAVPGTLSPRFRRRALSTLLGLLALTLLAPRILAEPDSEASAPDVFSMSLEELREFKISSVFGASRHDQKTSEAPASVSILTAEDIAEYGYLTLAEALRSVRGLHINYDRNYTLLGVRGFQRPGDSNGRILLMVDGQRVNEPIYDSAYIGSDFILDADAIDRIEVIRGPGSSVYGSNALFGVVNVVTKSPDPHTALEAGLVAASFGTWKERLTWSHRLPRGPSITLSGAWLNSAGPARLYYPEFDTPESNQGIAHKRDRDRAGNLLAQLAWGGASIQAALNSRTKQVPTASYETLFDDPRLETRDTQGFVNLKVRRSLGRQLDVQSRAAYGYYKYDGSYPYAGPDPGSVILNRDDVRGDWIDTGAQVTWRRRRGQTLLAGLEFRRNLRQDLVNRDDGADSAYSDLHRSSQNWGAYAQAEVELASRLNLTGGLRYDHHDQSGGAVSPRLAAVYHPVEATGVKLLFGRAFRAPNVWEAYFVDPVSRANPNLRPERIEAWEVALEQRLRERVSLSVSAFSNRARDLISQEVDPLDSLLVSENVNRVDARGVEAELDGRLTGRLRGRMSYAYQWSTDGRTGEELDSSPRHMAKFNLRFPLLDNRLGVGVEAQYSSPVRALSGARAAPYWLTSVTLLSRDLAPGLKLSAGLYNALDVRYAHPGGGQHAQDLIPQDGRTLRLTATLRH